MSSEAPERHRSTMDRLNPVEQAMVRRRRMRWLVVLIVVLLLLYWLVFVNQYVIAYEGPLEHFKYGSIGAETANGLPTLVFKALPVIYAQRMGPEGWRRFGFIYESGRRSADRVLATGGHRRGAGLAQLLGVPCRHLPAARRRHAASSLWRAVQQSAALSISSDSSSTSAGTRVSPPTTWSRRSTASGWRQSQRRPAFPLSQCRFSAGPAGAAFARRAARLHPPTAGLGSRAGRHLQPLQGDPVQFPDGRRTRSATSR